jgi:uncharacterized protein (DUF1697 family)
MRHAAFLRGINVGTAKRIAMADLRAVVESLGYEDVHTLLNSGNVVFTVPRSVRGDPAARIEKAVARELRVESRVMGLDAAGMAEVVAKNPLLRKVTDPTRHLVAFLAEDVDRDALEALGRADWSPGRFAAGRRAAYLWCPDGILASRLVVEVAKALRDGVTTRNWSTVLKVHARMAD